MFLDSYHFIIFSAANSLNVFLLQILLWTYYQPDLHLSCWKTFSRFLNMYLRLGGPYTVSVASSPLSSAAFQNVRLSINLPVIKKNRLSSQ